MYRAFTSIGDFRIEQDALDAIAQAEQDGLECIIKEVK